MIYRKFHHGYTVSDGAEGTEVQNQTGEEDVELN